MSKKVLVVEDNKNILLGIRMALEARGYEVKIVQDGVAAMEEAFDYGPDLILLDLVIPKLDGFLVLEGLKKEEKTRGIPVVIISARAAETDIRKARELGADDYVVKPFSPESLASTIGKFIKQ
jgi:DNA-binding response OmpR family regulator